MTYCVKAPGNLLQVEIVKVERVKMDGEWTAQSSMFNIHIYKSFISNYLKIRSEFQIFLQEFKELLKILIDGPHNVNDTFKGNHRPLSILSLFYKTKEKNFHFIYTVDGNTDNFINAVIKNIEQIREIEQDPSSFLNLQITKAYSQKNKKKYFVYNNSTLSWQVINPLVEIGKEIYSKTTTNFDRRKLKPTPIINEDNYNNLIDSLPRNWVIDSDNFNIGMDIPNDVALYSSLSIKSLIRAQKFLEFKIPNLKKYQSDHFIRSEIELKEFYDYFEDVISAIIFAYTSLEAFSNICIPRNYKITEIDKKTSQSITYNKTDIESKFSLQKKYKLVLKETLNTSSPTKEKWWSNFIKLEKLRHEIIHTKQVKSEVRYTKFLSKETFTIIESHREIIKFYGDFIVLYRARLLEDYPFGFGHDSIIPSLTTAKGYKDWMKAL